MGERSEGEQQEAFHYANPAALLCHSVGPLLQRQYQPLKNLSSETQWDLTCFNEGHLKKGRRKGLVPLALHIEGGGLCRSSKSSKFQGKQKV